jgi:hypothetical protein
MKRELSLQGSVEAFKMEILITKALKIQGVS